MGFHKRSSSIHDVNYPHPVNVTIQQITPKTKTSPNPNPYNYQILRSEKFGRYLVVMVRYPDATNYEGVKIMVYKNATLNELKKQNVLDPHFSDNKKVHSPIARFVPTQDGWTMAELFCKASLDKGLFV